MSFLETLRQFRTGSARLERPYDAMVPEAMDTCDTNETEFNAAEAALEPHIGFE